ncbi:cytochrome c maturation protein CcmE [Geobacter sp.]|uniref:cytochrome c maturation protein CcmE domain-containing protein n=1 Tax=Geobacter sp. TaxID=46610 RepID=UPI00261682C5|nr:cytochrome c maturation protein CcmE [Geobacter sp.]
MKRYILALAAIVITGIVLAGFSSGMGKKVRTKSVLSVNDIQADPAAYTGTITINGVVAGFSKKDQTIFGLVDTAEAKLCKTVTCGVFYLPVKYTGKAPKEGDEVNVTGSFGEKGRVFNATRVDVLRHLHLEGR